MLTLMQLHCYKIDTIDTEILMEGKSMKSKLMKMFKILQTHIQRFSTGQDLPMPSFLMEAKTQSLDTVTSILMLPPCISTIIDTTRETFLKSK